MGSSHVLAAPGTRTEVASGWRADVVTTAATIRGHSQIVVLGMLGFALRGGILFLALPIVVLPTSVEVRLLLGSGLGTSGLTPDFYLGAGLLSMLTLGLALLVLYVLAKCEIGQYARFVNWPHAAGEHAWPPPGQLDDEDRSLLASRTFVVETATLIVILLAAVPSAVAVAQSTYAEIVLPSSAASLYTRIISDATVPLFVFVISIVVIEAVHAVVLRQVLASAYGLKAHNRLARHPMRVVGVGLIGWVLFVGAVGVSFLVLDATWQVVESVFLSNSLAGDLSDLASAAVVAFLFAVLFGACLGLCGLVSTVRSGLWTLASLR
ncbi:MAG TPA: hypothetical protein VH371_08725 [Candidatus Limnocylindrales bacterium]